MTPWTANDRAALRRTYEQAHLGGAHLADELETCIIALHDPSNIAAVIVEPIAGSTGVLSGHGNWHNLLVRVAGDTVALSPPLIISRQQIDELVAALRQALCRARDS